jgi:penicillin-binding protein A
MAALMLAASASSPARTQPASPDTPRVEPESERAPVVELSRVTGDSDVLTAPLVGGGSAELTLDPALHRTAKRLLARARPVEGAVLLLDVKTGNLLVAATYTRSARTARELLAEPIAPAASLFKIVTTAALLQRFVPPDRRVCIDGGLHEIDDTHLEPARGPDARCSTFRNALGYSRNAVYAQLAPRLLDPRTLMTTAERLGFNGPVPADFPALVGTVDIPSASERLDFARTSAGFRGSKLSPLGAAYITSVIARQGRANEIRIIRSIDGVPAPARRGDLGRVMNGAIAVELRRMMEITVHSGTSLEAFTNSDGRSYLGAIRVAGKTGTLRGAPGAPMTTWFTGFAPSRDPEVVVTVLLNNGEVWRQKANEVARDALRAYFAARGTRGVTSPISDP